MKFYIGISTLNHAQHFERCMISVSTLRKRKLDFHANEWIMDSGAFTEITKYGAYRSGVSEYAGHIRRWSRCGRMVAAVAQDYMCEEFVLAKTGMTLRRHQELTVHRYRALLECDVNSAYIMPVLQGYTRDDYLRCIDMYGDDLEQGAWVGVGSVCKRNTCWRSIRMVLAAIKNERPDLRLHGFGVKTSSLARIEVSSLLHSSDSMSWYLAYHYSGKKVPCLEYAVEYYRKVKSKVGIRGR